MQVTTAYPFLLNVYNDYSDQKINASQFAGILDTLENFVVRRLICKIPTNALNNVFPPLYKQITASILPDIVSALKDTLSTKGFPKNSEFEERFAYGKLYAYGDNIDKAKLILETLEHSFKHHEQVNLTKLTIEHIMPQTVVI